MQKARLVLATMISKNIFLVFVVVFCGIFNQVYGDDDCEDLDLSLYYMFDFTGSVIVFQWDLISQTECPVLFHLTVRDVDLGYVIDDYLEGKSAPLDGISPCVVYYIQVRAINEATSIEGPPLSMGMVFSKKVQKIPTLGTIDIQATSINMTWTLEGETNRCPLIKLHIEGGSHFNQTVTLQGLSDTKTIPVEINHLIPNSMYFFRVYVENDAGMSPAAQIAVQTLELTEENE